VISNTEIVLYRFEKALHRFAFVVIIHGQSKKILDISIKLLLTSSDVTNLLKHFAEMIGTGFFRVSQAFVIQDKAYLHVLAENVTGSSAKMNTDVAWTTLKQKQESYQNCNNPFLWRSDRCLLLELFGYSEQFKQKAPYNES